MTLREMSFCGAVMILAIVAIRALAIHKLPKRAFVLLWDAALVRLLVPYTLPSAFSVYSLLGRFTPAAEKTAAELPRAPFIHTAPAANAAVTPVISATTPAAAPADLRTAFWLLGALVCAAFFAVSYLKCYREFKASLPADNDCARRWLREHRLHRAIEIRQSDRISAPLTYGVFHPVILMPKRTDWDNADLVKYVLEHEYVHIRRFDAVTKLVLTAAACVHWFNPAVWLMVSLFNRDIELSCDEAVIRRFGEGTKSAYAMTLIRMEEARSGLSLLCSGFSKNAIEERIIAIMKIKRSSIYTLFITTTLIVGMVFAFATSAQSAEARGPGSHTTGNIAQNVDESFLVGSYIDPGDGKTYYTWDGGETWVHMSDEELEAHYALTGIEWWTEEEYAAWLENEKKELQSAIGSRAWTSVDGWFTWTQEKVDETIAMYEGILENIKNGMLYSKGIDGEGDLFGMVIDSADMETEIYEGDVIAEDFSPYEPYGLTWEESEKALYFNGQRVRYFLDGVDLDGTGAMAIYLEYTDADFVGEIDVYTVRQRVQNADGSFDPMGPLTGLEKYSQAEYDMNTLRVAAALEAVTYTTQEIAREAEKTRTLLQAYTPFGLSYEKDAGTGELSMYWQGKPVHSVYDAVKGVWIANSMRGLYLGPDAVDLEAVYTRGTLVGLRETASVAETSVAVEGTAAEPGMTFAERFEKYAPFGITYKEAEGASGVGNVYLDGQLVSYFADIAPDGGAFSFTSAKQGGMTARTVYDGSGKLLGLEIVIEYTI